MDDFIFHDYKFPIDDPRIFVIFKEEYVRREQQYFSNPHYNYTR